MSDDKRDEEPPTTPHGLPEQSPEARRGQMRYQDPDSTTPREPTLAEQKARERAEKRQAEQEAASLAEAERKTKARRRVMVGGGVTVGVVALVAAAYSGQAYSEQKDAQVASCTVKHPETGEDIRQPDEYCDEEYRHTHGVHNPATGLWMMPLFLGGGNYGPPVGQYRYSYSPAGAPLAAPGQKVNNPNFTKPSGTQIKTESGKMIQRGGFGIGNKSSGGS